MQLLADDNLLTIIPIFSPNTAHLLFDAVIVVQFSGFAKFPGHHLLSSGHLPAYFQ
jgi:hypothetical protein